MLEPTAPPRIRCAQINITKPIPNCNKGIQHVAIGITSLVKRTFFTRFLFITIEVVAVDTDVEKYCQKISPHNSITAKGGPASSEASAARSANTKENTNVNISVNANGSITAHKNPIMA